MQKTSILLIITGGLIAAGMGLSIYGNQAIFEGLEKKEGTINSAQRLEVQKEIDPQRSDTGILAIQSMNFKEDSIWMTLVDPFGSQILSKQVEEEIIEEKFDVTTEGVYTLVVESSSDEDTTIMAVIGPEPEAGQKSLAFVSLYVLIVGMIGLAGVGIYGLKNRFRRE